MNLSTMTFHESFGDLPKAVLTLFRQRNVSPADFDSILMAFGWEFGSPDIQWNMVYDYVFAASLSTGSYRPSRFM